MAKRECPLLVLSPQARSDDQAREYKPFGRKPLLRMLREAAAGVSNQPYRRYDEHAVFDGFFFGKLALDYSLTEEIRRVPSSVVDCAIYRDEKEAASRTARQALRLAGGDSPAEEKLALLACEHRCAIEDTIDFRRAGGDEALFAYLWIDLCGSAFQRVGELMARRWGG